MMNRQRGIGTFDLLVVVLITLKVLDIEPVGAWSWWWVTAPLWGGMMLALCIALLELLSVARNKSG